MEGDDRTFRVDFSNEGVKNLRESVTDKLKEFMGDYTDDTLVDYVIVLLQNGKRKGEAKGELNVFLGEDDSDSFVSWLWDHLGSNLSLYVQPHELDPMEVPPTAGEEAGNNESHQTESVAGEGGSNKTSGQHQIRELKGVQPRELHLDEAPKTKATAGEEAGKSQSHQIESKARKGSSNRSSGHRKIRLLEGRDKDKNEVPLPQNSTAGKVNTQNEPRRRVGLTSSLSPRPTIQKQRRRPQEQQPRKREVPRSTVVSAPRRLLQFAVRDAVATNMPSNPTTTVTEPSLKRLRSVVSTLTGDEERPKRTRPVAGSHTSMSAAIKAVEEAALDVGRVRPSRNVFDRLGRALDVSTAIPREDYEVVAQDVGGGDFVVEMENFHMDYHLQSDRSRLQEENISSFHHPVMDSDMVYDDGVDLREETIDISQSGTSGGWVEKPLMFQYGDIDNADERLYISDNDMGQPPTSLPNTSFKIASSVSFTTREPPPPPQYQEESDLSEMHNHNIMHGSDAITTRSKIWLMKENNNSTVAVNGNAKSDAIVQQSDKMQTLTGLHATGPPTDDADSRTVFVSNVHFAATKDSLSRHFNKFGEVLKVIILTDPTSGQPKGSAYVEFMRKEASEHALSLDGTSFMSRILKIVKKSSAQPETSSVISWPRVARPSPFPRFTRAPLARGVPSLYRPRVPIKPGGRSFQWKREAAPTTNEPSNSIVQSPTTRSLTYIRTETTTNGSSGAA